METRQLTDSLQNHIDVAAWIRQNGGKVIVPLVDPWLIVGGELARSGDRIVRTGDGEFTIETAP